MLTNEERKKLDESLDVEKTKPSLYKASFLDPDRQAEIVKLSESRKVPVDVVGRNLDEVKRQEQFDSIQLDKHPKTTKYLSDEHNSQISYDDIDNLKAFESTVEEYKHGFISNTARGTLDRVNTLTGNFLELFGNIENSLVSTMRDWGIPTPGLVFNDDGTSFVWDVGAIENTESQLGKIGRAVSDDSTSTYGYQPRFTWEKFKGDMDAESLSGFIAEQGVQSIPDMLAAVFALPAYIGSRTEEIAEERVKNDKREKVEFSDLATSTIPAVAMSVLEKVGAKFVFNKGNSTTLKGVGLATAEGAAVEGGTEFLQEGIEYLGGTLGTQKEVSFSEMLDRQLAGLVAGSGMGGTIKGTTSSINALTNRTNKNIENVVQSTSEQQLIDKIITLSQSSKTRERKSDRFESFINDLDDSNQVHISSEAISDLLQDGIEMPEYITSQLDGLGGDVTLTISQFANDVAGDQEIIGYLREHVKLNPSSLTKSDLKQDSEDSAKNLLKKVNEENRIITESEEIYNDVKDQIVSTNRQSEQTAKFSAAILPKYVAGLAKRTGKSAKQIYESMGLKVVGPDKKVSPENKSVLNSTNSGVLYDQKFDDIMIEEQRTLNGKEVNIKRPAQKVWDRNIKRKNQAEKIRDCVNGS